jgi:branched-chain amino acid transport system ATP-binding protein
VSAMLEVKDLRVSYGKIEAVKGISFSVGQGEVVCLIGTNGAGKTTTLRTISGLIRPTSGEITFEGKRLDGVPAHEIVTLGLAHSPEGRRIFPRLSVEENLLLGAFSRNDGEIKSDLQAAYDLFPILGERSKQPAGTFSGGEQQMLAMGRAMMSRPAQRSKTSTVCRWGGASWPRPTVVLFGPRLPTLSRRALVVEP